MMDRLGVYGFLIALAIMATSCREDQPQVQAGDTTNPRETVVQDKPLYGFELNDIEGTRVKLGKFRGDVLLLVNVASNCGYTKQYAGLQALYETYKDQGLVVMGLPANDFGAQEPGTNAEIQAFCTTNFGVTFPMFAKISVKGDGMAPLYEFLTRSTANPDLAGDIQWNFTKFLVDRKGNVVGRYASKVEPLSDELTADVEKALAQTAG